MKKIYQILNVLFVLGSTSSLAQNAALQSSDASARLKLVGPASVLAQSIQKFDAPKDNALVTPFKLSISAKGQGKAAGYVNEQGLLDLVRSESFTQLGNKVVRLEMTGDAAKIHALSATALKAGICLNCEIGIGTVPPPPPPPPQWERRMPTSLKR